MLESRFDFRVWTRFALEVDPDFTRRGASCCVDSWECAFCDNAVVAESYDVNGKLHVIDASFRRNRLAD